MTSPMGDFEGDLEAEEEALSTRNAPPMTSMEGCEFTINNMSLKNVQICAKCARVDFAIIYEVCMYVEPLFSG